MSNTNFIKFLEERIKLRLEAEKVEFSPDGNIYINFVTGIRPTKYRSMIIELNPFNVEDFVDLILPKNKVERIKKDVFGG